MVSVGGWTAVMLSVAVPEGPTSELVAEVFTVELWAWFDPIANDVPAAAVGNGDQRI